MHYYTCNFWQLNHVSKQTKDKSFSDFSGTIFKLTGDEAFSHLAFNVKVAKTLSDIMPFGHLILCMGIIKPKFKARA